jgi:hypothetical protein
MKGNEMFFKLITSSHSRNTFYFITCFVLFSFTLTLGGCYTTYTETTTPSVIEYKTDYEIVKALTKNGLLLNLKDKHAMYQSEYKGKKNVLVYYTVDSVKTGEYSYKLQANYETVNINDLLSITVVKEELNAGLTILATIGVIAALIGIIGLIIALTKESCPFIYSFDGQNYVFDAEPYGGAISEGLTKTDYSKLEYLKPVNGNYILLMRNEADETQHTDDMKLLVVDHPENTFVTPDAYGNMIVYNSAISPVNVTDENGNDVKSYFQSRDDVQWQSSMPSDTTLDNNRFRNELTFKFPKPKDAAKVRFLVNAGTALWGGSMIKKMLELRGNKVDSWYKEIDNKGPALKSLHNFVEREELYLLKMNIRKNDEWQSRVYINPGGPFIIEDEIIELDISDIPGDTLYLKLNPPVGYWNIDYIGAIYDNPVNCLINEIGVLRATDDKANDITKLLKNTDRTYYDMPDTTCIANIYFKAPLNQPDGYVRTIFLKTTGYYDIHLKKDQPEQTILLDKLLNEPGFAAKYSLELYIEKMRSLGTLAR